MALTITVGDNAISVLFDGTTAWDSLVAFPGGILVDSMEFKPGAVDHVITVRDKTAGGAHLMAEKAASAYDNKIKYFSDQGRPKRLFPYVVAAEVTTGAMLIIVKSN